MYNPTEYTCGCNMPECKMVLRVEQSIEGAGKVFVMAREVGKSALSVHLSVEDTQALYDQLKEILAV